jgi:hypothetical protein
VAAGDLHAQAGRSPARDELGGLTRAFADMTPAGGRCARAGAARHARSSRAARARLQTILDNAHGRRHRVRPRAAASTPSTPAPRASCASRCRPCVGRPLREVPGLADFADAVVQRFDAAGQRSPEHGERDQWQESFELRAAAPATR